MDKDLFDKMLRLNGQLDEIAAAGLDRDKIDEITSQMVWPSLSDLGMEITEEE